MLSATARVARRGGARGLATAAPTTNPGIREIVPGRPVNWGHRAAELDVGNVEWAKRLSAIPEGKLIPATVVGFIVAAWGWVSFYGWLDCDGWPTGAARRSQEVYRKRSAHGNSFRNWPISVPREPPQVCHRSRVARDAESVPRLVPTWVPRRE